MQGDPQSLTCVSQNPSQPQLIVTGSINGNLTIWDIRFQSESPITNLHSLKSCIWEL
ncbi:hypothetical protein, partial [Salmonella sp. s51228]|uniref:hypothetical protein n=1 Tax=Salmonella sp. s51228 TaxID=3159652 RepID=UPI00397E91E2